MSMRRTLLSLVPVSLIAMIQSWAYYSYLPLSLGPRVILQPWMMHQGRLLYRDIGDEHAPLMYFILTILYSFVQNGPLLARCVLISLLTMNVWLAFWVGKSFGGTTAGVLSALFFGLWSPLFGYGKLWHETFLSHVYLLLVMQYPSTLSKSHGFRALFVLGLLIGVALLIKQHAIVVLFSILCWDFLVSRFFSLPLSQAIKRSALLLISTLIPVVCFVGYYLWTGGKLSDFVFWTIIFNIINDYVRLASKFPGIEQMRLIAPAYLLVLPAIFFVLKSADDRIIKAKMGLAFMMLIASSATAFPRFELFHLQTSLPILSVISGCVLARLLQRPKQSIHEEIHAFGMGIACSLLVLWGWWGGMVYYNAFRSEQPRRIWEYSDLISLRDALRERINSNECVYLLPDDEGIANLYYLMNCLPPALWVPTSYPWFTLDIIKQRVLQDLATLPPKWVIYFPNRWEIEQHGSEIVAFVQSRYQPIERILWNGQEVYLLHLR